MSRKKLLTAGVGVGTLAIAALGLAAPSIASATGSTPVTFQIQGGSLTITVPTATSTLTSGGAVLTLDAVGGQSVTGSLGSTTVTDNQASLTHVDTVTMTSTAFSSGSNTIAASNVTGYSGIASSITGLLNGAVVVPTATGQALSGAGSTVLSMTGVLGSASVTYNPTVSVAIPATSVAGTYTGTVTQTVSSA